MRLDGTFAAAHAHAGMVGREAELARIGEIARRLATGRGAVVAFLGEAGLGKTTVLEATIARAGAIVENLRTVHVPGRSLTRNAIPTIAGVVASAVPVPPSPATRLVEKVTRDGAEVSPEDPDVLRAALDIARTAASRRPLLVTVDNLPLSAHGVFPVFTSLAAAAASMPLLLVVTSSSVPHQAQELSTIGSLWIHRLSPLGPEESVLVVRQVAGRYVPRNVAAEIGHLTSGNPGDIRELCTLLTEDQLHGLEPLPSPMPGTVVSASVYRPWFAALSPEEQMLVLCAAIFEPYHGRQLEEATGVPVSEVAGLDGRPALRQGTTKVVFTDPRMASAVLAFTSQQELARAQEMMGRVLEPGSVDEAWHRLRSGLPVEDEGLAAVNELARDLLERGQVDEAGRLAREVRKMAAPGPVTGEAALVHGIASYHAGHLGRAVTELSEAVIAATDPATRFRVLVPLVLAMAMRDRMVPFDIADAGIGELAEAHPLHAASLAALIARKCATQLEVESSTQYLEQAERLWHDAGDAPAPDGRDVAYEIELTRHLVRSTHTPVQLAPKANLASLVRRRPADDVMGWDLAVNEVQLLLRTRRWQPARAALTSLRNRTRDYPSPMLGAQTTLLALDLHLAQWEVHAAVEQLESSQNTVPLHLPFAGSGQCQVARTRILSGQPHAATEWLERAQHLLVEHPGPPALEISLATEHGLLALSNGDGVAAQRHYTEALTASGRSAATLPALYLGTILAAAMTEDTDSLRSLMTEMERSESTTNGLPVVTAMARMMTSDPDELLARTVEAVELAREHLAPGHQGAVVAAAERALERLTEEEHAQQVAALPDGAVPAGRDEHRTALLTQARDLFDAAGVSAFTRVVDTRLAGLGTPTDAAGSNGRSEPAELTSQEQHIATLVANGASNKQVASTLFVSVRTVELRLTNVYRKLGIRSRRELRELMAQE